VATVHVAHGYDATALEQLFRRNTRRLSVSTMTTGENRYVDPLPTASTNDVKMGHSCTHHVLAQATFIDMVSNDSDCENNDRRRSQLR
jgi:hypothetical protein